MKYIVFIAPLLLYIGLSELQIEGGGSNWRLYFIGAFLSFSLLLLTPQIATLNIVKVIFICIRQSQINIVFCYLFFSILSIFWSSDFTRSLLYVGITSIFFLSLITLKYAFKDNLYRVVDFFYKALFLLCLLQFTMKFSSWRGEPILMHFHGVGGIEATIGALLYYARGKIRKRRQSCAPFIILLCIALLSTSVKIFFGLVVGLIIIFFLKKRKLIIEKLFVFIVFLLFCIAVYSIYFIISKVSPESLGKFEHLSGRTSIWQYLFIKYVNASVFYKVFGFGFVAGDKFEFEGMTFYNSHNMFLSSLINTGVIGFLLMFWLFISSLLIAIQSINKHSWLFLCWCVVFTSGFANQGIAGPTSGPWLATVFVLIAINVFDKIRKSEYRNEKLNFSV